MMNKENRRRRKIAIQYLIDQRHRPLDIASFLGLTPQTVYKIAKEPPESTTHPDQPKAPRPTKGTKADWTKADWTLSDTEIAVQLGVSRQRVNMVRREMGIKSGSQMRAEKQTQIIQKLAEGRSKDNPVRAKEIMDAIGVRSTTTALYAAAKAGVKVGRGRPPAQIISRLNWELPNSDLQEIWGLSKNLAANTRCRVRIPKARWHHHRGRRPKDPKYHKALEAEKAKREEAPLELQSPNRPEGRR